MYIHPFGLTQRQVENSSIPWAREQGRNFVPYLCCSPTIKKLRDISERHWGMENLLFSSVLFFPHFFLAWNLGSTQSWTMGTRTLSYRGVCLESKQERWTWALVCPLCPEWITVRIQNFLFWIQPWAGYWSTPVPIWAKYGKFRAVNNCGLLSSELGPVRFTRACSLRTLLGGYLSVPALQSWETQALLQDNKAPESTRVLLWVSLQRLPGWK